MKRRTLERTSKLQSALAALGALLLTFTVLTGCATKLAPEGVYQGDALLYQSELSIRTAYDMIQAYVKWERDNRAALTGIPEIKQSADAMRAHAPEWFRSAHALHDAYKADPSAPNKTALQASLDILRTALAEAAKYMAQAAAKK